MNFAKRTKRQKKIKVEDGDPSEKKYAHTIQFYKEPPTDNISLQEFEDLAIQRLKVLKVIESMSFKEKKGSKQFQKALETEFNKDKFLPKSESMGGAATAEIQKRRSDHISHFILRLAYCKSEELRRWFITQELELFRFRFLDERTSFRTQFLIDNDLHYEPIDAKEKEALKKQLVDSSYNLTEMSIEGIEFYKVPFTEALDLVRSRKIYVHKGYAYVPSNDLVSIVISAYRAHLSHALALTARAVPQLEEDNRLLPLLNNLSKQYLGQDYGGKQTNAGKVSIGELDGLSRKSFPLCMRHLHSALKHDHHLKYWGRMQYGLFLKAIGITLEQALIFWRSEFSKTMDVDKFDKQYAYNIRHNYGKEGKRVDYTPYSCMKIITSNAPGAGDHHGCPFRHSDATILKQQMSSYGVSQTSIDSIMTYMNGGHCQLACSRYFDVTHQLPEGTTSIQHPNHYFEESRKVLTGVKPTNGAYRSPSSQISNPVQASKDNQPIGDGDDFNDETGISMDDLDKMEAGAV
ncbi:DNA primase large subunit-like [Antedon mediterranea]|uniref:DNA primase large subunit-like n=1 Tax=Antedon mediterranea TaxID=105859 RepID=UPI003AF9D4B7